MSPIELSWTAKNNIFSDCLQLFSPFLCRLLTSKSENRWHQIEKSKPSVYSKQDQWCFHGFCLFVFVLLPGPWVCSSHFSCKSLVINSPSPLKTFAERRSNKIRSCHNISKPGCESQARASEIIIKKYFSLKPSVTSLLILEYRQAHNIAKVSFYATEM